MTPDPQKITVGANGKIAVGPVGVTPPTDVATPLDAGLEDAGTITEAGATLAQEVTTADFGAWHTTLPVLTLVSGVVTTLATAFREFSRITLETAMGGQVSANGGENKWVPPSPDDNREVAVAVEWSFKDKDYRLWIPRCISSESVEWNLVQSAPLDLAVTLKVLDPGDGDDPVTLFNTSSALAPDGS